MLELAKSVHSVIERLKTKVHDYTNYKSITCYLAMSAMLPIFYVFQFDTISSFRSLFTKIPTNLANSYESTSSRFKTRAFQKQIDLTRLDSTRRHSTPLDSTQLGLYFTHTHIYIILGMNVCQSHTTDIKWYIVCELNNFNWLREQQFYWSIVSLLILHFAPPTLGLETVL